MPEESLQGMEIDSGLEQVRGKAVAQHVDAAGLVDLGTALGFGEGLLNTGGADRTPSVTTREEEQLAWPCSSPVIAQRFKEMR